jgi:two-component system phosphate regulon sensor histidine kinase PhoR
VEQQVNELSVSALNDVAFARLGTVTVPGEVHRVILGIRSRHSIAQHVLLVENGRVVYPRTQRSAADKRSWVASFGLGPRSAAEVINELRKAERAEAARSSAAAAIAYERLANSSTPSAIRAWALFRAASLYAKLGSSETASGLYRQVMEGFQDAYGPDGSALAVNSALALSDIDENAASNLLISVEKDLASDRWIVSASERRRLQEEIARRQTQLGLTSRQSRPDLLDYVLAIERLKPSESLGSADVHVVEVQSKLETTAAVYSRALSEESRRLQVYYATLASPTNGKKRFLVLVPDPKFVENELVPKQLAALQVDRDVQVDLVPNSAQPVDRERGVSVSLPSILPELRLDVTRLPRYTRTYFQVVDIALLAAAIFMALLISLGLRILHRDLKREREMNRLKSDFISGVSHDMKTPLTLIQLYSETLLDSPEMDFSQRMNLYSTIGQESQRLVKLIESVLDYSRIQNQRKAYQLSSGDLARSVATTVELYQHYLERFGFSLSYESIVGKRFPVVQFDRDAISSVVVNLLENAVKYSRDFKFIRVDMRCDGDFVCLEIEDYGIGIPEEEQTRIFDAFYRVNNKCGKGGCGLGLYLVKHIVEGHRGRIEVRSKPGQGTTFRIYLPVASVAEPMPETASEPAARVLSEEVHAKDTVD